MIRMLNRAEGLLVTLSLCLCNCVSISVDTAYRKAWNETSPEHRNQYLELEPVFTKEEKALFLRMTDQKERDAYLKRFWKSKDPTPTTGRNEFKEEHERRVAYAKYFFSSYFRGDRLWDDRGKVYVKYGEPDERSANLSGVQEDIGSAYADATPYVDMLAGESWSYHRHNLEVWFQDKRGDGYYELVPYAGEVKPGYGKQSMEAIFAAQMASKIEIPTEKYLHDYGGEPLDYALDVVRFRNTEDEYEVSVSLGVPLKYLDSDDERISFVKSIVIFDNDYKEVALHNSEVNTKRSETSGLLAVSWDRFILKPGEYTIGVEVKDLISQRVGIYKKNILLPSHVHSSQRGISQIVMATDIRKAAPKDSLLLQRNGLVISSLPSRIYYPKQEIYFYYEIYDLKLDRSGRAYYIIQADLLNMKTKKKITLYRTNPIECRFSHTYEVDKIDASELKPADYILIIAVKDVLADKEKSTLAAFRVAKD